MSSTTTFLQSWKKTTEARRFFQYWSKVEKSAFLHNGGAPA